MGKKLEKRIKYIMEGFDFDRVQIVMNHLDWQWVDKGLPNIDQLRECAERLLREAWERGGSNATQWFRVGTGGFRAERDGKELKLTFVLEEAEYIKE